MRRWALNIAPHKEKYGGDLGTFDAVITMPATNFRNRPTRFTNLMRLLVVFPLLTQAAQTLHGRVVNIADGDTITVLVDNTPHKIRLAGIDAPEKAQSFGQVSKDHLRDLIADKMVDVEYHKKDRYRCVVGKVLLHGRDIDLEQIRGGMAWHNKKDRYWCVVGMVLLHGRDIDLEQIRGGGAGRGGGGAGGRGAGGRARDA